LKCFGFELLLVTKKFNFFDLTLLDLKYSVFVSFEKFSDAPLLLLFSLSLLL
jgi:hypothetical protein